MKLFGLIVVAVCLGTCSAGKVTSAVLDTAGFVTNVSSIINAPVNIATGTASIAVHVTGSAIKAVSTAAIRTGINALLFQMHATFKVMSKLVIIPSFGMNFGHVAFSASEGFFKDVTSLKQAATANVSMKGITVLIDVPITLHEIDAGYKKVSFSMGMLKAGAGITIHASRNTVVLRLALKPGIRCALNIREVDVTDLGGVDVRFSNLDSGSDWVLEKYKQMIINVIKENIKLQVQNAIDNIMKFVLREDGILICSKFLD
uniref:Uncharacterized protein n=1 Tax=Lygus hesperus TaxID=30085 RepID=A0A146LZS4_LYGHE